MRLVHYSSSIIVMLLMMYLCDSQFQPGVANFQFQPGGAASQFQPRVVTSQVQPVRVVTSQVQPRVVTSQVQPRVVASQFRPGVSPNIQYYPRAVPTVQPQLIQSMAGQLNSLPLLGFLAAKFKIATLYSPLTAALAAGSTVVMGRFCRRRRRGRGNRRRTEGCVRRTT